MRRKRLKKTRQNADKNRMGFRALILIFTFSFHALASPAIAEIICKSSEAFQDASVNQTLAALKAAGDADQEFVCKVSADNFIQIAVALQSDPPQVKQAFKDLSRGTDLDQKFKTQCTTALCSVKKIWGPRVGPMMLYLKLKYGVNTSPENVTGEKVKAFDEDELKAISIALKSLPESALPVKGNSNFAIQRVARQKPVIGSKGVKFKASADNDGKTIKQYDFNGDRSLVDPILFPHELAHSVYETKSSDFKQSWAKLSGWSRKNGQWSHDQNAKFVSDYAGTLNNPNPDQEDFAETVAAYQVKPDVLKACCSAKYQFVKREVFRGKEYLSRSCFGSGSPGESVATSSAPAAMHPAVSKPVGVKPASVAEVREQPERSVQKNNRPLADQIRNASYAYYGKNTNRFSGVPPGINGFNAKQVREQLIQVLTEDFKPRIGLKSKTQPCNNYAGSEYPYFYYVCLSILKDGSNDRTPTADQIRQFVENH